ncbi:CinA family protein [Breoghania sp.]|uniref:CinA family protein n=1 Tax=Breoghania sp. TaxID=2065378 RepID=UPI002AA8F3B2|nr:CinA family protein [Breoghania sp.]
MTDLTPLHPIARTILQDARQAGLMVAAAESCTGGLVSALLTELDGSSAVFERGFITYSNEAKMELLGVTQKTLETYGAVSEPTARAMAQGALERSHADIAVSITGIAGPGGGSADKPVGLVHFAIAARKLDTTHHVMTFKDTGRPAIRLAATAYALQLVSNTIYSVGVMSIP